MTMAVGDVLKFAVEIEDTSERAVCTGWLETTTVNETDEEVFMNTHLQNIVSNQGANLATILPSSAKLLCMTLQRINPSPTRIHTVFFGGLVGAVVDTAVSGQAAALMRKVTARLDKRGRGRVYFPFLPESWVESGQILDSFKLQVQTALSGLWGDGTIGGTEGETRTGIWSVGNGTTDVPEFNALTAGILQPVLATQKRRVNHHQDFA